MPTVRTSIFFLMVYDYVVWLSILHLPPSWIGNFPALWSAVFSPSRALLPDIFLFPPFFYFQDVQLIHLPINNTTDHCTMYEQWTYSSVYITLYIRRTSRIKDCVCLCTRICTGPAAWRGQGAHHYGRHPVLLGTLGPDKRFSHLHLNNENIIYPPLLVKLNNVRPKFYYLNV